MTNTQGHVVGRMARAFTPPQGMICTQARVLAIQTRNSAMGADEFLHSIKSSHWETVVPELVFCKEGVSAVRGHAAPLKNAA